MGLMRPLEFLDQTFKFNWSNPSVFTIYIPKNRQAYANE